MLCAISGEAPEQPVASRKSGNVFEKRLVEAYISSHGTDPVNGEELSVDDLVDLKSARVVKPRPPTLTSIPSLLSVFQNEWDALALETFTLKQQLSQLRQELSTALYNNDAAVRVIARLTRERDEARDALGKVSLQDRANGASRSNGDAMAVDSQGQTLPPDVLQKVQDTEASLSKTRRKRPIPEGWTAPEDIQAFELSAQAKLAHAGSHSLALEASGAVSAVGGVDGTMHLFNLNEREQLEAVHEDDTEITDVVLWSSSAGVLPVLGTASGEIRVIAEGRTAAAASAHAGAVTGLSLHPSGDLLASVGVDKSFAFHQLSNNSITKLCQTYTDSELTCTAFHPDGHLLAAGSTNGEVKVFAVKTNANVANFATSGPVRAIDFSENGYWLAVANKGSALVSIWDLRKAAEAKTLDTGSNDVCAVKWDYTGQYLAAAGAASISVHHYDKSAKAWSELLSKAAAATALQWRPLANGLVVLAQDGGLQVLA